MEATGPERRVSHPITKAEPDHYKGSSAHAEGHSLKAPTEPHYLQKQRQDREFPKTDTHPQITLP